MRHPHARLMVFARAPVPGAAKTRLIPALGAEGAAALHAQLCCRTLALASAARLAPVELWCSPDTAHPFFAACRTAFGVDLRAQHGSDLGSRMAAAFDDALDPGRPALIIGTDCPGLGPGDLRQAFQVLHEGCDAVLGPAEDGGYVLIGLARPAPGLFADVDWGTDRVLAQTREHLRELGLRWHELAPRRDVDRPEDLIRAGLGQASGKAGLGRAA